MIDRRRYRISGMSVDQPVNNWLDAVHDDYRLGVGRSFATAIGARQGLSVRDLIGTLRRSKRSRVQIEFRWSTGTWSQLSMRPLAESEDEQRFVGSVTDVSELKRLERLHIESLEQRATEAENMRRLQEQAVDVSSHEVRGR
jgi:hypothetical protein